MILTGPEIRRQVECGRITIDPFEPAHCTTNSYDLQLGSRLLEYTDEVLDPEAPPNFEVSEISPAGRSLHPGEFVLGETRERIGSDHFVPLIHARSGTARMGLFVHVTADLIDLGFVGVSTLQLLPTLPIVLKAGAPVAQVSFWVPKGEIVLYRGKYQNADGPRASLSHIDGRRG